MDKFSLKVGDIVDAAGYKNPQKIICFEKRHAVFRDIEDGIQGTQTYENIIRVRGDLMNIVIEDGTGSNAFGKQIAGSHYSKLKIQPMEYCLGNGLNYAQSNVVKYVTRYKDKNGIEDLKKAIHCIELLIDWEENNAD